MSYEHFGHSKKRLSGRKRGLIAGTVVLVVGIAVALALWRPWQQKLTPEQQIVASSSEVVAPQAADKPSAPTKEFSASKLKQAVESWQKSHGGTVGITIMDENGKTLAETNGHHQFFTASIYKLYTAYVGYQKIDDGTNKLSEPYLSGWTRGKCLYEMIHQSHSPCAEKLWNELGKSYLTTKLETFGINDTDMTGLLTTSHDAALMLVRIQKGEGLSSASRKSFLDSMHTQIYRDGLPAGFTNQQVYDKVGFRGNVEYHDTAIVKFKDGRVLIVAVLTQNVGSKAIANLAQDIAAAAN